MAFPFLAQPLISISLIIEEPSCRQPGTLMLLKGIQGLRTTASCLLWLSPTSWPLSFANSPPLSPLPSPPPGLYLPVLHSVQPGGPLPPCTHPPISLEPEETQTKQRPQSHAYVSRWAETKDTCEHLWSQSPHPVRAAPILGAVSTEGTAHSHLGHWAPWEQAVWPSDDSDLSQRVLGSLPSRYKVGPGSHLHQCHSPKGLIWLFYHLFKTPRATRVFNTKLRWGHCCSPLWPSQRLGVRPRPAHAELPPHSRCDKTSLRAFHSHHLSLCPPTAHPHFSPGSQKCPRFLMNHRIGQVQSRKHPKKRDPASGLPSLLEAKLGTH